MRNKKRVGILTFWGISNYGAFFQAYSLKKTIEILRPDYSVEVIPYINPIHFSMYYGIVPYNGIGVFRTMKFYKKIVKRIRKRKDIQRKWDIFSAAYYELSNGGKRISGNQLKKEVYDTVILGSDIIWDFSVKYFGKDLFLFGNNLVANNIFSYATSIGTVRMSRNMHIPKYVYNGIRKLSSVSVRDVKSKIFVNEMMEIDAVVVPDPTILWDFLKDSKISNTSCISLDKYFVVYGSFFSKEIVSGAIKYKNKGYKMVLLDSGEDYIEWCDIRIDQKDMTPFQWAKYIRESDGVITSTFHGLLFGILFEKRVVFFPTQFINDKITDLVDALELKEPLFELEDFDSKYNWEWNYHNIRNRLLKYRNEGKKYLRQCL